LSLFSHITAPADIRGWQTFSNIQAILPHLPADMTGEEPQNVDTVLFVLLFNQLHMGIG